MAFPYIPSGGLIQTAFNQFRKSIPAKVDSSTLKKLGIASSNEGAIINILKFIGVIDDENNKTAEGGKLFTQHEDAKFQSQLSKLLKASYSELFELHGDTGWKLDRDSLISFFRGADETSAVTGARQATTFQTLAALAGKRDETVTSRASSGSRQTKAPKPKPTKKAPAGVVTTSGLDGKLSAGTDFGLTVRVEINLPANGSEATYDNIFKSIRKNLLDGRA